MGALRVGGEQGGMGRGRGGVGWVGDEEVWDCLGWGVGLVRDVVGCMAAVWWVMGGMGRGRSKGRLEGWVGFVGEQVE